MTFIVRRACARAAVGTVLACLVVASAAAVIPPGTALADKQELVRNNGAEPESLDPHLVESAQAINILNDLFEGLTAVDNHGKVVPGAAQSWRQTDATTWVFKLRRDGRWSNGEPVTAQDFAFAWRRFVDPKTAAALASAYGGYVFNGVPITQGKLPTSALGVRVVDAWTLEVKTSSPVPFFPYVVAGAQFAPLPHVLIEKFGKDWTKPNSLVSNGAYVLKDWRVNSKIVIEKNPKYWDAAVVRQCQVPGSPPSRKHRDRLAMPPQQATRGHCSTTKA